METYRITGADGREYGPIDLLGLLEWVREGRIVAATMIRKGDEPARPASEFPELAEVLAFGRPALPAPPPIVTIQMPADFEIWAFVGLAWQTVKPHWLPLALMALITSALGAVPYLGACVMFVIGGPIAVGVNRAILGMLAGRPPTVGMMFDGFDRFGPAFLAQLVIGILVTIGTLLCVVPGIILAIMWVFTLYVIGESPLDFWDAMKRSAALTEGYRWHVFGLLLAGVLVSILGFLCCCVGVFVAQPVVNTSIAIAYRWLQAKKAGRV